MNNYTQVNHDRYVEVICEMLKRADLHSLELIWIYASAIIDNRHVVKEWEQYRQGAQKKTLSAEHDGVA